MNRNSIIAPGNSLEIADLILKFAELETCMLEAEKAKSILEEATGALCESWDFNQISAEWQKVPSAIEPINRRRILECINKRDHLRIIFYAAKIRVYLMMETLKKSREELVVVCEEYRNKLETGLQPVLSNTLSTDATLNMNLQIGRINVFFCNQLALDAYKLYHDLKEMIKHGVSLSQHWAQGHKVDLAATLALTHEQSQRVWAVRYSLHSKSRFDGPDPEQPPPGPLLTLDEAKYDAFNWVRICDGDADPVNMQTGDVIADIREQR